MKISKHLLLLTAFAALVAMNFSGCCGSSCDGTSNEQQTTPTESNDNSNDASEAEGGQQSPSDGAKLTGPAAATYAFLDAARRGDDATTRAMLTPTARTEIARLNLNVAPASSDTATFVVGEVKNVVEKIAHVASRWTDVDASGKEKSHEMTWILRQVDEGWRIGGMATIVFKGEPPLLLNFEKPQEMLEQKQMLREEIARRASQNR